jgi:hypothetical protein
MLSFDLIPAAKFIVPDCGDKVEPSIGLSYWPAWLQRLAGRYDNPITRSQLYLPQLGTKSLFSVAEFVGILCTCIKPEVLRPKASSTRARLCISRKEDAVYV